jgi:hypothetical protein
MALKNNAISWFEIGVNDLERATRFYQHIFSCILVPMDTEQIKMRLFPITDMQNGVGGALVDSGGFHKPSITEGPLIYLNGDPDLQLILDKVTDAGGTVMVPKTPISDAFGFMAVFIDTEGNRVGLHSAPVKK